MTCYDHPIAYLQEHAGSVETPIRNAGRFMAEASCDGIKLEGGAEMMLD